MFCTTAVIASLQYWDSVSPRPENAIGDVTEIVQYDDEIHELQDIMIKYLESVRVSRI